MTQTLGLETGLSQGPAGSMSVTDISSPCPPTLNSTRRVLHIQWVSVTAKLPQAQETPSLRKGNSTKPDQLLPQKEMQSLLTC